MISIQPLSKRTLILTLLLVLTGVGLTVFMQQNRAMLEKQISETLGYTLAKDRVFNLLVVAP